MVLFYTGELPAQIRHSDPPFGELSVSVLWVLPWLGFGSQKCYPTHPRKPGEPGAVLVSSTCPRYATSLLTPSPVPGPLSAHSRAAPVSPTSAKLRTGRPCPVVLVIPVALRRMGDTEQSKLLYDWFNFFFQQEKKE